LTTRDDDDAVKRARVGDSSRARASVTRREGVRARARVSATWATVRGVGGRERARVGGQPARSADGW